jgi:hypothetical protein
MPDYFASVLSLATHSAPFFCRSSLVPITAFGGLIPPPHRWNEVWFKTEEETATETKGWQLLFLLLANVFPF